MLFHIHNLTKTYENGKVAIDSLSLRLAGRGLVTFTGVSGSGKTTLLNILSRNDDITSGTVEYNGIAYDKKNAKDMIADFAYIHQDYKLIENMSVYHNLKIALELSGKKDDAEVINTILNQVGLAEFTTEKVLSLSAGQKQRVAIARAIIRNPKALFADEPTGNLDTENTDLILQLLKELSREMLVLVVTHDKDTVENYADRIIALNDGKIISDRTLSDKSLPNCDVSSESFLARKAIKPKLSFGSAFALGRSLCSAKKLRKSAFSIIIVLITGILVMLSSWTLLSYEKCVIGNYNKLATTKGMMIDAVAKKQITAINGNASFVGKADLTALQSFIGDELGANSAKVVDISNMVSITREPITGGSNYNVHGQSLSMAAALSFDRTQYVILSDDPQSIGIEIIKGNAPKNKNEFAIPSGIYDYVNAVGGIKNPDKTSKDKYIIMTGDELIGKEFYGVKIVGVFEDNIDIDSKYNNYNINNIDEGNLKALGDKHNGEKDKLQKKLWENMLCKSVITATNMEDYYQDVQHMNVSSRGVFLSARLNGEEASYNRSIAPLNDNTQHYAPDYSISSDEILIPNHIARDLNIKAGDRVNLDTEKLYNGESGISLIVERLSSKKYKAVIGENIDHVFLSDADYRAATGNWQRENSLIYYYEDNINANSLTRITDFVNKNYNIGKYDSECGTNFIFDYSQDVKAQYSSISSLITIIGVALAVVAVIYLLLAFTVTNVNITSKTNEILILKSLGISFRQLFQIYGLMTAMRIICEFALGVLLGWLLLLGFNGVMAALQEISIVLVPFDAVSVAILLGIVALVNITALIINVARISGKNLRRAFQKSKE